jgi:hypothetical protein
MEYGHEGPEHLYWFFPWLVADNFGVRNRMRHAMGELSFTLVLFSLGRRSEVAQVGMNRRVMEGIETNIPLPPEPGAKTMGMVM